MGWGYGHYKVRTLCTAGAENALMFDRAWGFYRPVGREGTDSAFIRGIAWELHHRLGNNTTCQEGEEYRFKHGVGTLPLAWQKKHGPGAENGSEVYDMSWY